MIWNVLLSLHSLCTHSHRTYQFHEEYMHQKYVKIRLLLTHETFNFSKNRYTHIFSYEPDLMCDFRSKIFEIEGNMIQIRCIARNIWFQNMKFIFSAFQLLISWKLVDLWSVCVFECVKCVWWFTWLNEPRWETLWNCAVNTISLWIRKVSEMSMQKYNKSHRRCFKPYSNAI